MEYGGNHLDIQAKKMTAPKLISIAGYGLKAELLHCSSGTSSTVSLAAYPVRIPRHRRGIRQMVRLYGLVAWTS